MKKAALLSVLVLLVGLFSWIPKDAVASEGWTTYTSKEYEFTMLVPVGTSFNEVEYGNGWGSLQADYNGIQLFAIGKLGRTEPAAEIEKYGVKVTGVPY